MTIKYPPVKARKNQCAQKDAQKRILYFLEVHRQNTYHARSKRTPPGRGRTPKAVSTQPEASSPAAEPS